MKVLVDHNVPFRLAHGGAQTQIQETMAALSRLGVDIEPLKWWDPSQQADLIHYFGLPGFLYTRMAHVQHTPVVATLLLTSTCNHSESRLKVRGRARNIISRLPGGRLLRGQTNWTDYEGVDRFVVGLKAESRALELLHGVDPSRTCVVPLGLGEAFLDASPPGRDQDHLITSGTITDRKRSVELARMALEAQVPVLFVGKPYNESDAYWKEFKSLVDGRFVKHLPHVDSQEQMIQLLQSAKGFVIYSQHENWCLSAHEAAAVGLPILVQDQPWSRECFGGEASYLLDRNDGGNVARLRNFYDRAMREGRPNIRHLSWNAVARMLVNIYEEVLKANWT